MENDDKRGKHYLGQESGNSGTSLSKNYYKQNLQTLDEYLQNKSDYEIYEQLTVHKDNLFGLSKETLLRFFQLLYQQICFVERNKNKPLLVAENLEQLSLTDEQSNFLYAKVLNHFEIEKTTDEKLEICCREIVRLQKSLDIPKKGNTYDPPPYYPREKSIEEKDLDDFLVSKFNLTIYQNLIEGDEKDVFDEPVDFFRLFYMQLEFIEQNPSKPLMFIRNINQLSINERQRRLLFYYINELLSKVFNESSDEQIKVCQSLIESEFNKLDEKLFPEKISETSTSQQLEQLEATSLQSAEIQRIVPKEREGMNIERAFLFFEYLLTSVNATTNKTKKNQVIERLTGYKFGQLSKLPSWFEKEKLENEEKTEVNEKFLKDMNEVSKLFISLGLTEIADKVEKDLDKNY